MNFDRKKDPQLLCLGSRLWLWTLQRPWSLSLEESRVNDAGNLCREYELLDTGILDDNKYFDVVVERGTHGNLRDFRERALVSLRSPQPQRYAQADLDDTLVPCKSCEVVIGAHPDTWILRSEPVAKNPSIIVVVCFDKLNMKLFFLLLGLMDPLVNCTAPMTCRYDRKSQF